MKKITMGTYECTDEDINSVTKALKSNYLSVGPELRELENKVSKLYGKKYGLMVNSGQSALEVALILAKVKLHKEKLRVAVPATTYAATLWAIINTGNEPVFVDIDKDYNINISSLVEQLYPFRGEIALEDIDVVLAVDLCGKSAEIPERIRNQYFIIEDACEAFGNPKCNYGDIVCFSFYVSHIITSGSGGMLCLNDKELYKYAESYISHGRVFGGDFTAYKDKWVDRFLFDKVGVSYRSDNIAASLALSQLERLNDIIARRQSNARKLWAEYYDSDILMKNFIFPDDKYYDDCVFQFFPILIKSKINRKKLLGYLFEHGIDSRVLLSLTNQSIIQRLYGDIEHDYPVSANCNKNGFIIGCHQGLNFEDMEYIAQTLENFQEKKCERN